MSRVWADCLDTARSWIDDEWVIWQDDRAPTMAEEFLNILNEFSPSFFENSQFRSQHCQLYDSIVERVAREKGVIYSAPENTDEASQRADCYYSLGRHFEKLAAVPIWSDAQRTSLYDCAAHFRCEGSSLSEGIPPEPDDDDGPRDSSAPSEDMNINDLFRDL